MACSFTRVLGERVHKGDGALGEFRCETESKADITGGVGLKE